MGSLFYDNRLEKKM